MASPAVTASTGLGMVLDLTDAETSRPYATPDPMACPSRPSITRLTFCSVVRSSPVSTRPLTKFTETLRSFKIGVRRLLAILRLLRLRTQTAQQPLLQHPRMQQNRPPALVDDDRVFVVHLPVRADLDHGDINLGEQETAVIHGWRRRSSITAGTAPGSRKRME